MIKLNEVFELERHWESLPKRIFMLLAGVCSILDGIVMTVSLGFIRSRITYHLTYYWSKYKTRLEARNE